MSSLGDALDQIESEPAIAHHPLSLPLRRFQLKVSYTQTYTHVTRFVVQTVQTRAWTSVYAEIISDIQSQVDT